VSDHDGYDPKAEGTAADVVGAADDSVFAGTLLMGEGVGSLQQTDKNISANSSGLPSRWMESRNSCENMSKGDDVVSDEEVDDDEKRDVATMPDSMVDA
jgi:hypothetical protein